MDRETVSATEFKAKCLDLLDQVSARQISRLEITKRGKIVAVLIPPTSHLEPLEQLHGFLRGDGSRGDGPDRPGAGRAIERGSG